MLGITSPWQISQISSIALSLSEAVDKIRRQEHKALMTQGCHDLKAADMIGCPTRKARGVIRSGGLTSCAISRLK